MQLTLSLLLLHTEGRGKDTCETKQSEQGFRRRKNPVKTISFSWGSATIIQDLQCWSAPPKAHILGFQVSIVVRNISNISIRPLQIYKCSRWFTWCSRRLLRSESAFYNSTNCTQWIHGFLLSQPGQEKHSREDVPLFQLFLLLAHCCLLLSPPFHQRRLLVKQ